MIHEGRKGGGYMWYVQANNIKAGKYKEYQNWLKKNEKSLREHAPKTWKYVGTFGTVLGFGRYDTYQFWQIRKYGDFDTIREYKEAVWDRLSIEGMDFLVEGTGEAILIREMSDVITLEPRKKKK
jgi:hypothetical protein